MTASIISDPPADSRSVRLLELSADAEYAEWRARLYRATPYGPRVRPGRRLRKLEEASHRAQIALARADTEAVRP